jgi:transposase
MPGKHKNRKSTASPSRIRGQRLSERERTKILTLATHAHWSKRAIARELRIAESTVRAIINSGIYTPQKQVGRRPILTTQKRRRLVARATKDALHRRMPLGQIAHLEGIQVCSKSLHKAFEREGYFRRKATQKPLLTDEHKAARLAWAIRHRS